MEHFQRGALLMAGKPTQQQAARKKPGPAKGAKYNKVTVKTHSEKTIKRWEDAARKLAREKGCTIEYHLLSMLFDEATQDSVKASIMKTYNEALIVKKTESKSESTVKTFGPTIGLPPMRQDPALTVVGGKK
jgi:hypothetical protein